jgi:hypothetical protein
MQGAAELIRSLSGEPHEEAVQWVLKYAQNAKINYRVSGLHVLAALLDKPNGGLLVQLDYLNAYFVFAAISQNCPRVAFTYTAMIGTCLR